jgi:hypothetical protein
MQTAKERLQFVICFAQKELESLRAGDWLNLREDCLVFLGIKVQGAMRGIQLPQDSGGIIAMPLNSPFPMEFSVEDFKALQADTLRILDEWAGPAPGEQGRLSPHDIQALYTVTRTRSRTSDSWVSWLQVQGTTRDLFLLILFHLLGQESMDYVRRCPECRMIFCRIGKQQYHSKTCANRANVRKWRQTKEGKSQEQERAHKRYVKKTKQASPGAKVVRRPRKGKTSHAETPRES